MNTTVVRLVTAFEIKVYDMLWLKNRWVKIERIIDRKHDSKTAIIYVSGDKDPFHLNGKDFFMIAAPSTLVDEQLILKAADIILTHQKRDVNHITKTLRFSDNEITCFNSGYFKGFLAGFREHENPTL
jgi:hypothetical protein